MDARPALPGSCSLGRNGSFFMNDDSAGRRWDERYATSEYLFGTEPNSFLVSMVDRVPVGRALCLGEGEGRNAVFLAGRGFDVTAVDASAVGIGKARRLAAQRGARIVTVVADLASYGVEPNAFDLIVLIFVHLPPGLRRAVHAAVVQGLRPGGALVLEAYTPEQLELGTGGPQTPGLFMRVEPLLQEFAGLRFEIARELRRDVREGTLHQGESAVVQMLGFAPAPASSPGAGAAAPP
jgi:SAM-dependent methyltransferase